jgi:hypothetical protein
MDCRVGRCADDPTAGVGARHAGTTASAVRRPVAAGASGGDRESEGPNRSGTVRPGRTGRGANAARQPTTAATKFAARIARAHA